MTFLIQSKSPGNVTLSKLVGFMEIHVSAISMQETRLIKKYIRVSERLTNLSRDTGFSANDQTMMKRGQHA